MGTVLEKANKIKETKNKLKEAINDGGGQITNNTVFNNYADEIKNIYIDAISDGVDNLYNNFPKVIGDGSEITLDTEEAPMKITLEGNTTQKTSILPEGYTQVDYIKGTGTQYLDTGLILTQDNSVELEISMNVTNDQNKMIFGSRSGASDNNISINATTNLVLDFNSSSYSTYRTRWSYAIDTKYILYTSKEKRVIYDENRNILNQGINECSDTITTPQTATLFYINPKPTDSWYNASAKIYYCKIWNNDTLVRNIIPCYRNSDNEVGMYDLITDTFYTNQGTGVFTYNSVVQIPKPDYPQDIKVVTSEQNIKIRNKNLFDYTKHNALTLDSNGRITTTEYVNQDNIVIYKLKPNTKYTFSFRNSNMGFSNYGLSMTLNGTWVQTNTGKYTLTSNSNGEFSIKLGADSYNSRGKASAYIQLEEGTSVTEYVSYQSQTYSLSLENIELARIGNYKDYIFKNVVDSSHYNTNLDLNEWYLHKEINKVVFDGSEDWEYEASSATPTNRTVVRLRNEYVSNAYLSNRFVQDSTSSNRLVFGTKQQLPAIYISLDNSLTGIATSDSDSTKLQKVKTYLSENNVLVYFDIIPTNTKIINTTLIQQLENLNNNVKSYLDTTIIECSSIDNTNEVIQTSIIALKNINLIESEWSL